MARTTIRYGLCSPCIFDVKVRNLSDRPRKIAVFGYAVPRVENAAFTPSLAAAFPLVNVILLLMARHGILADEALVRAADRIR